MLRRFKEWIIRAAAFLVPTLALAGVYAILVKTYYLDPSAHRKLLLANAPIQSHFEHLRRKWGFHPERDIASVPGEVVKGRPEMAHSHGKPAPVEVPPVVQPAVVGTPVTGATLVHAPKTSFEDLLAGTKRSCEGLGVFELLEANTPIAPVVALSAAQRAQLIALFEKSKASLLGWLFTYQDKMTPDLFEFMRDRIAATGMKLPPVDFEPDLELRSSVVWTRDPEGVATVAVGSKFLKVLAADSARAQFEMTRAMAQGWAPCEFNSHPWAELIRCFGLADETTCAPGEFSEGSWAMSSVLASYLSFPNCRMPAFESSDVARCLMKSTLPPQAKDQQIPNTLWKVGS